MTKSEKLSLLSEMIAFAESDGEIKEIEMNFLKAIANQLGVDEVTFDQLLENKAIYIPLKPEAERILQFHRLVLLMNVDTDIHQEEIKAVYEFGLKMGLSANAIKQVLEAMHQYPNKVVPPEILIDIFKRQYN